VKRIWTIIGVTDVRASFKWYQSLFGQPSTDPGHDHFGQLVDTALERARTLAARFEEGPLTNPNTQTKEFSLRDPDG
jgi:hypothetical protein